VSFFSKKVHNSNVT